MKLRHLACFLLLISVVAGCSGLKTYPNTADKNLMVRTKTSRSLFRSVEVSLQIYNLDDDCNADYLGSIKLKNGDTQIGIATDQFTCLAFVFVTPGIIRHTTILTPRPGVRYIADISYADSIYNVSIHEAGPSGTQGREIDRQVSKCQDIRGLLEEW
jgi:hypothetical protein